MAIVAILLVGVFSYNAIPQETQPEIEIPQALITTVLPGANPSDVESLLTDPLEQELSNISEIKKITSNSSLGLSSILIEFETGGDMDENIQELKDKVDLAKPDLPEDATDPTVTKFEANSESVVTISLASALPLSEITKVAETVQDELEKIEGVSEVDLIGEQQEIVEVKIDSTKLEKFGLTFSQVAQIIDANNVNFPLGIINNENTKYSIRIDNRLTSVEQIQNLPIAEIAESTIYLKDISTVTQKLLEQNIESKLSYNGETAFPTISLQVYKESGGNVIEISDTVKAKIKEFEGNIIPKSINTIISNDNADYIRTDLGILTSSGLQTTVLIVIILFLALGLTEGLLAGITVPLALMITVSVLYFGGYTINSLTLFASVIALGLMVDTAIVMMEGLNEGKKKGLSSVDAAYFAIEKYRSPLIAGTLTTIFAFLPMLFVDGLIGEFLKALPITISTALIASIVLSLTIVPTLAAKFTEKRKVDHSSILDPLFEKLGVFFEKLITAVLAKRSYKIITLLITIALFFTSLSLPITGLLKAELFPKTDFRYFIVNIETPTGNTIENTKKVVSDIEEMLYTVPEIESFLSIIGSGNSLNSADLVSVGGSASENMANITVNLVPEDQRELRSYELSAQLIEKLNDYPNADIQLQEFSEGPPSDAPVTLRITGENIIQLKEISADIRQMLEKINGTQNVRDDISKGLNEINFSLNRDKLSQYGLSTIQVAAEIRSYIQGNEASKITINDEEFDIVLKSDISEEKNTPVLNLQQIKEFNIPSPTGNVKLGELANFKLEEGLAVIRHEDEKRIVKVRSDLQKNKNAVEVTAELEEQLKDYQLPDGYEINFGGDTEEITKQFQQLFALMIVGVILIGFTLVIMFNSLSQPFVILLSLPLAVIGVFPGLMLIGLPLSFPAFLGVTALAGVVVNDAIVLIDQINQNRKQNFSLEHAISDAAHSRLQPIIMTTFTTVVGILPLALTNEFWAGLGYSLMFGLTAATGLTLIVMPVLYYLLEKTKIKLSKNR